MSSIFRNNPPGTGGAGAGNDTIPPLPERAQTELSGLYRLAQLGLEQGWVNTYNLDWEELEAFLKKKFPDVEDFSPTVSVQRTFVSGEVEWTWLWLWVVVGGARKAW